MPPTRRRPIPSPTPVRRPRVAGLRHPESPAQPAPVADGAVDHSAVDHMAVDHRAVDDGEVTQVIPKITEEPPVRPRPTRKPRQTWTDTTTEFTPKPKPAPEPKADTGSRADMESEVVAPRRNPLVLPVVLAVVAVLIGGLASWFGVQWVHTRDRVANTALVDGAGTAEVSGQVVSAVSTIFSYNYTNMAKTETAVQHLLTGSALCQYNLLYKVVKQQAPSQKLVLTTTVQAKGVEMLQGDTARVLLLVQQTDTRASTNQTSTSQSMIAVNAMKQSGAWKISGIDTFNGDNSTPGCK